MHIFENYVNLCLVWKWEKSFEKKKKATQFNVHSKTGQAYAYVHIKKAALKQEQKKKKGHFGLF